MSVVLLAKRGPGEWSIGCDSASFLGDWQIPGGQPKAWSICQGEVMVGMCGNKRWRQLFPFYMLEDLHVGNDFDAAAETKFADIAVSGALDTFAAIAAQATDKRGEDGMLTTDLEMVIAVPKLNRVYYIAGLTLTVIDLTTIYDYALGLGAGGVAAQAAASAFHYRSPVTYSDLSNVRCALRIATKMSASCKDPIHAWAFIDGVWVYDN